MSQPLDREPAPAATVVLPVRDAASTLGEQLSALDAQDFEGEWEIIVVDNGSRDGSADIARRWCADRASAKFVVEQAAGVSRARNAGAYAAGSPLLLFCESDDVVSSSWVRRMVEALGSFDLVGGALDYSRLNTDPVLHSRNHNQTTTLPSSQGRLCAMGANLAVSRLAFDAVDGFDPCFLSGGGDTEFCLRVQDRGFTIGFAPDAVVHYRLRDSIRELMLQQYRYSLASQRLYAKRRELGITTTPPLVRYKVAMRQALELLTTAPSLVNRRQRWRYLGRLGKAWGSCVGLLRFRIPPF